MVSLSKGASNEAVWSIFGLIILVITGVMFYAVFSPSDCDAYAKLTAEEIKAAIECVANSEDGLDDFGNPCNEATVRLCQLSENTVTGQGFLQSYYGLNLPDYMIYFQRFPKKSVEHSYRHAPFRIYWSDSYPIERAGIGQRAWDYFRLTFTEWKEHSKTEYLDEGCTSDNGLCFNTRGNEQVLKINAKEYPVKIERDFDQRSIEIDMDDISEGGKESLQKIYDGDVTGGIKQILGGVVDGIVGFNEIITLEYKITADDDPTFHLVSPCYGKLTFEKDGDNIVAELEKYNTDGSNYCYTDEETLDAVSMAYISEVRCVELDIVLTALSGGSKKAVEKGALAAVKEGGEELGKKAQKKFVKEIQKNAIKKYGRRGFLRATSKELMEYGAEQAVEVGARKYGLKFATKKITTKAFSEVVFTSVKRESTEELFEYGFEEFSEKALVIVEKEFVQEIAENKITKESLEEIVKKKVSKEFGDTIINSQGKKQITKEIYERIGRESIEEASEKIGKETGEKLSEVVIKKINTEFAKGMEVSLAETQISRQLANAMKEQLSKGLSETVSEETTEKFGKEFSEQAALKINQKVQRVISESTSESFGETLESGLDKTVGQELTSEFIVDTFEDKGQDIVDLTVKKIDVGLTKLKSEIADDFSSQLGRRSSEAFSEELVEKLVFKLQGTILGKETVKAVYQKAFKKGALSYLVGHETLRRQGIPSGKDALAALGWPCLDVDLCRGLGACIETMALWPGFPFSDLTAEDMRSEEPTTYSANAVFEQCCVQYNYQGEGDPDYVTCDDPEHLVDAIKPDVDPDRYRKEPYYDLNLTALGKYLGIAGKTKQEFDLQIESWCSLTKMDNVKLCEDAQEVIELNPDEPGCIATETRTYDFEKIIHASNILINFDILSPDCESNVVVQTSLDGKEWEDVHIATKDDFSEYVPIEIKLNEYAGYTFQYVRLKEEPAAAMDYCFIDDSYVIVGPFTEPVQAELGEEYTLKPYSFNYFILPDDFTEIYASDICSKDNIQDCTSITIGDVIEGTSVKYLSSTGDEDFEIIAGDTIGIFVTKEVDVVFE